MSIAWNPSAVSFGEQNDSGAVGRILAQTLVFAAVIFNFVLCFINTNVVGITERVVISTEIILVGAAFGLVWNCSRMLYDILYFVTAYFFAVMTFRGAFDAKIVHDVLTPIVFFFVGSYFGTLRSADKLVTFLIFWALGAALFEWVALDTYLSYFNVLQYYVARGTETNLAGDVASGIFITDPSSGGSLFVNATRFQARTLLPFLGEHRVSGIFLEPVSVGNFGAIAFAWVLLRDYRRVWVFIAKILAILTILVLADARFGFYFCIFELAIYLLAPMIRPTTLFLAPFFAMISLAIYAGPDWREAFSNDIAGRFLHTGYALTTLDTLQLFGLRTSDIFGSNYAGDVGYGYVLVQIGLLGIAAIWALFAYAPVPDTNTWRFKNFVTFYLIFLLTISASLFSIKTAALLWFLYGTLHNPNRAALDSPSGTESMDA
jgi:putative polymerase